MHEDARFHPRLSALFVLLMGASALASSCYLTSSFDGLTGADPGSGGASSSVATSSSSSGTGGEAAGTGGGGGAATSSSSSGTGGADAFPATMVLDDFNRPNGNAGSNWKEAWPDSYGVENNQLAVLDADPNPDAIYWSSAFGPRQEVYVTLVSFTDADAELELLLKNQGSASECDAIAATYNNFTGTRLLQLTYCQNNDQWTHLEPSVPITFQPGDRFGLRSYENGMVEAYRNDELLGSWDASGWSGSTQGGRIGIFGAGLQSKVVYDDFGGGDF